MGFRAFNDGILGYLGFRYFPSSILTCQENRFWGLRVQGLEVSLEV